MSKLDFDLTKELLIKNISIEDRALAFRINHSAMSRVYIYTTPSYSSVQRFIPACRLKTSPSETEILIGDEIEKVLKRYRNIFIISFFSKYSLDSGAYKIHSIFKNLSAITSTFGYRYGPKSFCQSYFKKSPPYGKGYDSSIWLNNSFLNRISYSQNRNQNPYWDIENFPPYELVCNHKKLKARWNNISKFL